MTKLLKNKWFIGIVALIIISQISTVSERAADLLLAVGCGALLFYLQKKSSRFKNMKKFKRWAVTVVLVIIAIGGIGSSMESDEQKAQRRLAEEKTRIEKLEKKEQEKLAKEEAQKLEEQKKAEEAAKEEAEKKQESGDSVPAIAQPAISDSTTSVVSGELKVHFIDVGQADSILVQQGSNFMLVDAGNNADAQTVKSYLDKQGVKELQYFVGTHKDEDHIGSADYIINSFKVGKIYFPRQTATTKTFEDFVVAAKAKGGLTAPNVGDSFKLGDATITVLAPNSSSYEDANDYSIVLKVVYGNTTFLLTGDAESISEGEMVSRGLDLSATVLKIGHHGSRSSTNQSFLNKVNPKYAVISVGRGNSYGHPTQEVMSRLKAKNIPVYRTDENGTVVATSNGKEVSFSVNPGSYNGIAAASSSSNSSSGNSSANTGGGSSSNTSSGSNSNTGGTGNTSTPVVTTPPVSGGNQYVDANGKGLIKGNINSKKEKIYHMPDGAYYDKTNAEELFKTEAEAQAAGYRRSSR